MSSRRGRSGSRTCSIDSECTINLEDLKGRKKNGSRANAATPEVRLLDRIIAPDLIHVWFSDYLLYGRFYLPTRRLDALYSTRLSPTLQASIAAISQPLSTIPPELQGRRGDPSNIMINLQHDVGKWCTEYTYSAEDSMWGVRFLHNFGRLASSTGEANDNGSSSTNGNGNRIDVKRVDEEDPVAGGLKGRVSIGAEFYFSAKERSAGGSSTRL